MSKEKKGRKFGRNRKSPAAKMYLMVKRADTNKQKRIKRHLKRCPNDAQAMAALKAGGSLGPKKMPHVADVKPPERFTMEYLVDANYKKAHRIYMAFAAGVMVDIGPHYQDVRKSYDKVNTDAAFCVRTGSIITILERKRSTPFVQNSYKLREFLKNVG